MTNNRSQISVRHCVGLSEVHNDIQKFWEIEEIPKQIFHTPEEVECEEHFKNTHSRNIKGQYIVRLPFKSNENNELGSSLPFAKKMLAKTEYRVKKDPNLERDYYAFLQEYQNLQHMIEVNSEKLCKNKNPLYIPHFPIIREGSTTTRVRIVFNASSQTSTGTSINDKLLTGPKLQNNIISILIRWRTYKYVLITDICKMFRQILIDERDVDYQRIVCRLEPHDYIRHFKLLTVTYGMVSSPFLANRVLKQLAEDEGSRYPLAKNALINDFYVDDGLIGADNEKLIRLLKSELIELLKLGGFTLSKWSTNLPCLLDKSDVNVNCNLIDLSKSENEKRSVLGILWDPCRDEFLPSVSIEIQSIITKRSVLSLISRLFDPLGWIAPVIIVAKILMQEIWLQKIEWDQELPPELLKRWKLYYNELSHARTIRIPRWTNQNDSSACEIHGYADASKTAYAAVVYIRVLNSTETPKVSMLIAKSKVAPLKTLSLPRLELCAVVLLTKLIRKIVDDLSLKEIQIYGWTDSMVVLSRLNRHPSQWPVFIANRVSEVLTLVPEAKWGHVPTSENPADCASRGLTPSALISHKLWWQGPNWLLKSRSCWPSTPLIDQTETVEKIKITNDIVTECHELPLQSIVIASSTWPRLLRITAYCFRFIKLCKLKLNQKENDGITAFEMREARLFWFRTIQKRYFAQEIDCISKRKPIGNSPLKSLCPFFDKDGLLRVTGRLDNAPITWDAKHPIILPKHRISTLIIEQTHARSLHGGHQLTLFLLRQNFWIIGAKNTVRLVIHKCVNCTKHRANISSQLMGELPSNRVTPSRAFLHTGTDYAGPIQIRQGKGRGHTSIKGYICIFICMSTRAVHIEAVTDYTAKGFLAAFTRFVSRRGLPSDLYSDSGPNYCAADKQLKDNFRKVCKDSNVQDHLSLRKITWHFNPPYAPHFGGLWEAGIKSVKHHFRRVVGSQKLTYEELATLLCQIEACLNSRPIGAFSNNSDDFAYLTPGHFLGGAPPLVIPESSTLYLNENRLTRWQFVHRMSEEFWKRWSVEYPLGLQQRYKWNKIKSNIKVGDLVLVCDVVSPKTNWTVDRITSCHPGEDGLIRVVSVKTQSGNYRRPITKICLLPVNVEN